MTPVNAVWFVVFFSVCLNCIAIGSTETATAIFNITAPALDLSYIAVILAHQVYKNKVRFIEGPFTLGKWGTPINTVAIGWVLFISVVLFFPPVTPVTPQNMLVNDPPSNFSVLALTSTGTTPFASPHSLPYSLFRGGGYQLGSMLCSNISLGQAEACKHGSNIE